MPRLDLLSEEDLDFGSVLLLDQGENGGIDRVEHLGRERADIVEVELKRMESGGLGGCEPLSGELGCKCHGECFTLGDERME